MEILLPKMKYTHEIVGTHGGALLPEPVPLKYAPRAKSLVCINLNVILRALPVNNCGV